MSRNTEYQFVSTDTEALVADLISAYEKITGTTVQPSSPEKLFILWVADVLVQERVLCNYAGNQNLPSRAEGKNLDALGELFYSTTRPVAQAAFCTVRFEISGAQTSAVLIPAGTRVTDANNTLIWATTADAYVAIGSLYADVMVQCETTGTIGNGYAAGQINTLIDPFDYYDHCANITTSDGGANKSDDDEYYELMRASQDAYSSAGPKGGYIYFAKQVSTEIADVVANTPVPGQVSIYVLMNDGTIAGTEIKNAVLSACNDDFIRPLTDYVSVDDPETVGYDIAFTYYIPNNASHSSTEIREAVEAAVEKYKVWQSAKLGRDINPSYLVGLLMQTGIKRVDIIQPTFTSLRDGSNNLVPQIAAANAVAITDGGYEDE
ncbi:MAG TPA: baseplate J/gp47 family protein [Clostridia bacterium]|nr:baseplate J/gp47 family protein [Clostridia bacterium]